MVDDELLLIYDSPKRAAEIAAKKGWEVEHIRCQATGGPVYHNWEWLSVVRPPESESQSDV